MTTGITIESTAVSTALSAAPAAKWYSTYDAETQNYITQRGLADKDPAAAFLEAAKAHREAQAYIGVPKEQLLKLPKADAPPEEWDAVWQRLGAPKDASGYDFSTVKFSDGSEAEPAFVDFLRAQAAALHLSPENAQRLAAETVKFLETADATVSADEQAAATRALEQLRQSWGANYDAHKVIADRAYAAVMQAAGFDQAKMTAAVQQLGSMVGKVEAMQMLLAIGMKMGEDQFVGGGGPGGNTTFYTKESAVARINELKQDSEFAKRWLAGGVNETKEMSNLHQIAYGNA